MNTLSKWILMGLTFSFAAAFAADRFPTPPIREQGSIHYAVYRNTVVQEDNAFRIKQELLCTGTLGFPVYDLSGDLPPAFAETPAQANCPASFDNVKGRLELNAFGAYQAGGLPWTPPDQKNSNFFYSFASFIPETAPSTNAPEINSFFSGTREPHFGSFIGNLYTPQGMACLSGRRKVQTFLSSGKSYRPQDDQQCEIINPVAFQVIVESVKNP